MIDALLRHENDDNNQEEEQSSTSQEEEVREEGTSAASAEETELKELMESRKCKVCHKEDACVVFVPCGHLTCCLECGNKVNRCPACKSIITERIRSYLS